MWSIAGLVSEASNQELIRGETCPRLFSVLLFFGNMIARDEKYMWSEGRKILVFMLDKLTHTANAGLTGLSEKVKRVKHVLTFYWKLPKSLQLDLNWPKTDNFFQIKTQNAQIKPLCAQFVLAALDQDILFYLAKTCWPPAPDLAFSWKRAIGAHYPSRPRTVMLSTV